MEVSGQLHAPTALHATHCIGSWVGSRTGANGVVKRKKSQPLPKKKKDESKKNKKKKRKGYF
jgi:hypothetical protein